MAGLNIKFVAMQLDDTVGTVLKHYAKWIDEQGSKAEMDKLKARRTGSKIPETRIVNNVVEVKNYPCM
ncbi:hypothetical protein [Reinekea marinisedimentorum]|nr:hypothetical protein [Reinekea marinisedimentorum]